MRRLIAATLTVACAAAPAAADVLHLRNGGTVEGQLKRLDATVWLVTAPDRRATFVPVEDVASIEITARPNTDPVGAARRLAAVRRAVAHVDDPAAAVAQYRTFVAAGADPGTLALARQDMAVWQDRADRQLVRLGTQWVSPAARDRGRSDSLADAAAARQLLKQAQFAAAAPLVAAALATDPDDVSAQYLNGLLQLQQNQPAAARASFEAVAAAVPDHAPTRVNLAVIDWQQGRTAAALARYDEAMILTPAGDPAVLARVSAALAAAPPAIRRSPVFARVTARFHQQEQQVAVRLTAQGLHRFGTAWLTDDQFADVRRGQAADAATLDRLAADFAAAQDRVRGIDLALADVTDRSRHLDAPIAPGPWLASYDGGADPAAAVSLDLQNDADQLRRRRSAEVARLDATRRLATAVRRHMTGQSDAASPQHVIGPEGTPVRLGS